MNRKSRWLATVVAAAWMTALAALVGCTTAIPWTMPGEFARLELDSKQAKPGKPVQGKDCVTVILNAFRFAAPSVLNAEQEALQAAGTKMLTQKTVYFGVEGDLFFIKSECWYVEGRGLNL